MASGKISRGDRAREHGTAARYSKGPDINGRPGKGCRCNPCRAAARDDDRRKARLKAYGQWQPFVDAGPVRAHIKALQADGLGMQEITRMAGVSHSCMARLLYGDPSRGTPPSKLVRPETAAKILAVTVDLERLSPGVLVDGSGTRRRLQALAAAGWWITELARRLCTTRNNLRAVMFQTQELVTAATARAVKDLYRQLWNRRPPQLDRYQRSNVTKTRKAAQARGWVLPAAWDDELIDLPDDDLDRELRRRATLMDDEELRACHTARYAHGDMSPMIIVAAKEWERRRRSRPAGSGGDDR